MPAKGEIHVRASADSVAAAARWLRSEFLVQIRAQGDTVLTPGHSIRTLRDLEKLAVVLSKAAARKRPTRTAFLINVPRPLVERFASIVEHWSLPPAVADTLAAMRVAAQSKRGRPSLTNGQRSNRVALARTVDERHRKRLASRMRRDQVWGEWFDEIRQRGETVLTTTVQPPKI